jgi:hypothetical protein
MAAPDQPPPLEVDEAAFDKARSRSALQDWMRKNHAMLARRLKERRLLWTEIAKVLGEQGVRDAKGNPPTADAARRAWTRATEGRASRSKRQGQKRAAGTRSMVTNPAQAPEPPPDALSTVQATPAPAPEPIPPPSPISPARPPVDLAEGVNPPPKPRFGFARPRQ